MPHHDISALAARAKEVSQALSGLSDGKDFEEFFRIIHGPGWTTIAEFMLVGSLLDGMLAQTKALVGLKHALLAGSRAVTAKAG